MKFTGITSDHIPEYWPRVHGLVADALSRSDEMRPEDVFAALMSGNMQLWAAFDDEIKAIAITEIQVLPKKRLGSIVYCTGDQRQEWEPAMEIIEAWAKAKGCAGMKHVARPGWERVLAPMGYTKTHVILEKDFG